MAEWRLLEWPAERELWLDLVHTATVAAPSMRSLISSAVCGSSFVSTLRVFRLRQRFNGEEYAVGGIGEVCTHPDFRGKGHSKMLLERAVGVMQEQGLDYSLLHAAEPFRPFYARAGWSVPLPSIRFVELQVAPISKPSVGSARVANRTDIPKLHRIWSEFSESKLNGIQSRDLNRWAGWIWAELAQVGTLYVWENAEGDVSGYCSMATKRGSVQCRELGILDGVPGSSLMELIGVMVAEVFQQELSSDLAVLCPRGAVNLGDLQPMVERLEVSEDRGFLIHPLGGMVPAGVICAGRDNVSYPSDGF